MPTFEEYAKEKVSKNGVPQFVAQAIESSGELIHSIVLGDENITNRTPAKLDTIFWQASCSKLVSSIAALQVVEKGLIGLDDDISSVIPEAASLDLIAPSGDTTPEAPKYTTTKNTKPVTLRQLLSHSSGLIYPAFDPHVEHYSSTKRKANPDITLRILTQPIRNEPGKVWRYGPSLDWAGEIAARLSKTTFFDYYQTYIFDPLGLKHTTFDPRKEPFQKDLVELQNRGEDGNLSPIEHLYDTASADRGGAGIFSSTADMILILKDLLSSSPVLLSPQSIDLLFENQFPDGSEISKSFAEAGGIAQAMTGVAIDTDLDVQEKRASHALGGMIIKEDMPNYPKDTLVWGGMANTMWFVNRKLGAAGFASTNVQPFGDPQCLELIGRWRKEVFKLKGYEMKEE